MNDLENIRKASKRSAIISLLGMLIFVCSLIFSTYSLYKADKKLIVLQAKSDSIKKEITQKEAIYKILQIQESSLRNKIPTLVKAVKQSSIQNVWKRNMSSVHNNRLDSVIKSANNSLISVAIYGYHIDNSLFNMVPKYFVSRGYTVIESRILPIRPSWLSNQSIVLYYDNSMKGTAQVIALELSSITGKDFTFNQGQGFGVIPGQEKYTLKIHFVR